MSRPAVPRIRPDFAWETAAGRGEGVLICGVDEVGRGPLAGPVLAGAVILPPDLSEDLVRVIDDSKRLSRAARERIEPALREIAQIGIGAATVEEIDRLNILQASLLAMQRAVADLGVVPDQVLVDGRFAPPMPGRVTPVIHGDRVSLSIAAASIVAKVARDRIMRSLALEFPRYGWDHNAGYPTREHRDALKRYGVTTHHRCGFAPVSQQLAIRR
ncbi:MAG: ribonuclease HII [Azospirillum sp.]|nr:ribonuclease HII [Azospirillum sp.]